MTPTHIHIAVANGLGWGFDGMDGVIFALASPLIIKDFGLSIPQYRSGLQIALLVGIAGMFAWPWLADRYGRRTLLAINIALFSLMMPVLAICTTWAAFVAVRCVVNFALNGEWSLGSMLVAETWPAACADASSASTAAPGVSAPRWRARSPPTSSPISAGVSPSPCPRWSPSSPFTCGRSVRDRHTGSA